jgi:hypothetical protein
MHARNAMICAIVLGSGFYVAGLSEAAALQQRSTPPPTVPADAENVRAEIRSLEAVLPRVPDRGATLFLLARNYPHVGDLHKALTLLKECVSLDAGSVPDPNNSPSLPPLETNPEFRALLTQARRRYSPVHKAAQGKLLERYASPGQMPYDLNDLVLRGKQEIFTTDTEGHHVYRFDRLSHTFANMKLWRPVFYPNGITLSDDGNLLFVADMLGVIRVDLRTNESADVDPGSHNTISGIDGLYWHKRDLLGVQYGTGEYRIMRRTLSPGRKVTASETLEYRSDLVSDPTTGAILEDNFYFIANTGIYNLKFLILIVTSVLGLGLLRAICRLLLF